MTATALPGFKKGFPFLLLPTYLGTANRAKRREKGDLIRSVVFGGVAIAVATTLFAVSFWLTWQLTDYEELGEYLLRLGISWLFLTFLSFLAFSALVTSLSTFFLSEDLKLLLAAPIPQTRLFYSRYSRTLLQSSWMVLAFLTPVLLGIGLARCAPAFYYLTVPFVLVPFVVIPVAFGCIVTLMLVNVFPAKRARDILMLTGLLFAVAIVMLLRFIRPERLLSVRSLPDITAFFATLQSPITPLLPSFWAGEATFAPLMNRTGWLYLVALWSTALASTLIARMAYGALYFEGFSKSQEARKARFSRLAFIDRMAGWLPLQPSSRSLLLKDMKIFMRDSTQWSQLLLLVALVAVYLYNFTVLDLDRIPYMGRVVRNAYAFVNLAMASFVLSSIAVRFVFPAVSMESTSFWIVRTSPVSMSSFLWSKFATGFVPVVFFATFLTIAANQMLGVHPFLKVLTAVAVVFMSLALVGMAAGLGAQYPRFGAENVNQIAGSYGGVVFMVTAVAFICVEIGMLAWPTSIFLFYDFRNLPIPGPRKVAMIAGIASALGLSLVVFHVSMKRGIRALTALAA
jgi:ABC-2 type transport system permease protein